MALFDWKHGEYELVIKDMDPTGPELHISTEEPHLGDPASRSLASHPGTATSRGPRAAGRRTCSTSATSRGGAEILSHVNGRATVEQICDVSTCRTSRRAASCGLKVLGVIRRSGAEDVAAWGPTRSSSSASLTSSATWRVQPDVRRSIISCAGAWPIGVDGFMETCRGGLAPYGALFDGVDLRPTGARTTTDAGHGRPAAEQEELMVPRSTSCLRHPARVRTRRGPGGAVISASSRTACGAGT